MKILAVNVNTTRTMTHSIAEAARAAARPGTEIHRCLPGLSRRIDRAAAVVAMGGYLLFSVVNFALMVTGVIDQPWGLRSVEVFGIPLGLIVGLVAVVLAAISLAMDFEAIQRGVEQGLPTRYAWAGAFGLVVTLVWLYLEFLRILAILYDN